MKPNRKLKKPQTSCSKLDLEEIIGLTVTNGNGLASSISDSKFVYIAGCVVVIYDADLGTQSHLMVSNRSPKALSCVAVSQDGSYVAAGESGHQPAIIVWNFANLGSISELKGHQHGISCTAFSPDGKHLVSVGTPQDGNLCLWDYKSGTLVKKLKTCSPFSDVASVSFSADGKFILSVGKRHIKIWTVGLSAKTRAKTQLVSLTMHGKHVNLGDHKSCTFIDITTPVKINGNLSDEKSVLAYALTSSGVLCVLQGGLTISNSVNLMVEKAYALSASEEFIACACNNGIVKLYNINSLEYSGDLHYIEAKQNNNTTFPDAIACNFSTSQKLVVVYRDHSLYIWNIHGNFQATKCCVLVSHSECIWDIKNLSCENNHDSSVACVARGCTGGISFTTCSADGTIRLWDLSLQTEIKSTLGQHRLITEPLGTLCLVCAGTFELESSVITKAKGYRSMAVSSDGKHLVAGDSDGNLHIFNLQTSDYTCIQDAHKGEIISLNFSSADELQSYYFLASCGRDKIIHLFDVNRNFDLIASIDDHSTAVKLTKNGHKIIGCGSDRSLIFHDVARINNQYNISHSIKQKPYNGTINDIVIDPTTQTVVTVGQDKKINIFDIASGQVIRSFKQGGDFGDPIKVACDPSYTYVACSYSDRFICVYDLLNGDMVARAMGHSEAINGIVFLPDCKHLVSVGSDGCIFVWKLGVILTTKMLEKIKENSSPLSPSSISNMNEKKNDLKSGSNEEKETPNFRLSVSRLPHWAKSKVNSPFPIISLSSEPEDFVHTPYNHDIEARKTSQIMSTSSDPKDSTAQQTCRSFALDKRWLTIHNVCLDLLNSPYMNQQTLPLSQHPDLEATDMNSGSNSTISKVEASRRKSFFVKQDLFHGQNLGIISSNSPQNLLITNHISSQPNSIPSSSKSTKVKPTNMNDQQEPFKACIEALKTLDTSTKTALEVFSKLKDITTTSTRENSVGGIEAEFYAESANKLKSIAKNVHEIAKLASLCGVDKVDIPGFEPLLGKFAESLSKKVIELLKENCTTS